jgi:hypothetical protein
MRFDPNGRFNGRCCNDECTYGSPFVAVMKAGLKRRSISPNTCSKSSISCHFGLKDSRNWGLRETYKCTSGEQTHISTLPQNIMRNALSPLFPVGSGSRKSRRQTFWARCHNMNQPAAIFLFVYLYQSFPGHFRPFGLGT